MVNISFLFKHGNMFDFSDIINFISEDMDYKFFLESFFNANDLQENEKIVKEFVNSI